MWLINIFIFPELDLVCVGGGGGLGGGRKKVVHSFSKLCVSQFNSKVLVLWKSPFRKAHMNLIYWDKQFYVEV